MLVVNVLTRENYVIMWQTRQDLTHAIRLKAWFHRTCCRESAEVEVEDRHCVMHFASLIKSHWLNREGDCSVCDAYAIYESHPAGHE